MTPCASGVALYALSWAFVQHMVNQWEWTISKAGAATALCALVSGISAIVSSRLANRQSVMGFGLGFLVRRPDAILADARRGFRA